MADIQLNRPGRGGNAWVSRLFIIGGIGLIVVFIWKFDAMWKWGAGYFKEEAKLKPGQVRLLVSKRRIPAYAQIDLSMCTSRIIQLDVIKRKGIIHEPGKILTRVALVDIPPGTGFREYMLAAEGTQPGIKAGIPPGWGAVTLPANELDGPVMHLKTGDPVAILGLWDEGGGRTPRRTTVISRTTKVLLAVKTRMEQGKARGGGLVGHGGPSRPTIIQEITLTLSPDDLRRLSEARGKARIQLVLIGDGEFELSDFGIGTEDEPSTITVIKGTKASRHVVRPERFTEGEND